MARFFKKFVKDEVDDNIAQKVNEIWFQYDFDRSGYLDKRESLVFLKEFLTESSQGPPSAINFNKWFAKYDLNKDGHISKNEMASFVREFMGEVQPQKNKTQSSIQQVVNELFEQHDTNRNGILESREALNLLKDLCARKGQPQPSIPYFNRMF